MTSPSEFGRRNGPGSNVGRMSGPCCCESVLALRTTTARLRRSSTGCPGALAQVEASPAACRHHPNTLDDEAYKLTALAEVRVSPHAVRLGMKDDSLLALAINLAAKTLHLPFQPCPDRAVPALADGAAHVELVVEGLQTALR